MILLFITEKRKPIIDRDMISLDFENPIEIHNT